MQQLEQEELMADILDLAAAQAEQKNHRAEPDSEAMQAPLCAICRDRSINTAYCKLVSSRTLIICVFQLAVWSRLLPGLC